MFSRLEAEDIKEGNEFGWVKILEQKEDPVLEMDYYVRPEGEISMTRVDFRVKDAKVHAMIDLMTNLEKLRGPYHKELKVIERPDENTSIWYSCMQIPNMTDMDVVMKTGNYS